MLTDKRTFSSKLDSNPKLDSDSLKITSGENLPHWQYNQAIYHISFRLADSVPQKMLDQWLFERECLIAKAKNHNFNKEEKEEIEREIQYFFSDQIEKYLDSGYGKCYLAKKEISDLIANCFTHFNNIRYRLHAWCIMPNHVHAIVEVFSNHDLFKIIHSWKSYTAHKANQIIGQSGSFWQKDAFNRIIRSQKEYHFQIQYVWKNPEKAGLNNWQWR